jgi:hypothetical protein
MALELSVDATIMGAAKSWSLLDVEYGEQEPLLITVDNKTAFRLELALSEHADGVTYSITVVSLETSWRGKTTETVLARPTLISPPGQEASVKQGYKPRRGPEVDVFEVTIISSE